jgi:hypothetical protein
MRGHGWRSNTFPRRDWSVDLQGRIDHRRVCLIAMMSGLGDLGYDKVVWVY